MKRDLRTPLNPSSDDSESFKIGMQDERKENGASLSWENIRFEVKGKEILKGINGQVEPGQLCAIMGPSGAGKSTLLNALSGRLTSGKMSGRICVNGSPIDPLSFRTQIAYVMQEDALFATQTPREALSFSAALRLPKSVSAQERAQLVESMLDELGLQKCANTYIGSVMIKGISGGEKKRTAIGIELISNPRVLFLDEPTSGLDSYAAYNVVQILQRLSLSGTTIICTIHQPSSEVFDLFDETLLIADGQLIYHDTVPKLLPYFAELGHACKENYNPADFVMFLMQKASQEEIIALQYACQAKGRTSSAIEAPKDKTLVRRTSSLQIDTMQNKHNQESANICTQFGYLGLREVRNLFRAKAALIARIFITLFLNIIVGVVFKDAAVWPDDGNVEDNNQVTGYLRNHFSGLFQVAIGQLFGLAQPVLLQFPLERPVFLREYAVGTYSAWPYFISKLLVEIPMAMMQSALAWVVTYWLIGFQGNILYLTLASCMLGLTSASTALLIGSAVSNVETAIQLNPVVFVPQLLFAGFFIPIATIPSGLRWIQYLCALKYSLNLVMIAELKNPPSNWPVNASSVYYEGVYGCTTPNLTTYTCPEGSITNPQALFPGNEITVSNEWVYFGVLMAVFCAFRLCSLIVLSYKAKRA